MENLDFIDYGNMAFKKHACLRQNLIKIRCVRFEMLLLY